MQVLELKQTKTEFYSFKNLHVVEEVMSTDDHLFNDIIELYVHNVSVKVSRLLPMFDKGQFQHVKGTLNVLLSSLMYFDLDELTKLVRDTIGLLNIGFDTSKIESNLVLIEATNRDLKDYLATQYNLSTTKAKG